MKRYGTIARYVLVMSLALTVQACMLGQRLATETADPAGLTGTFTLMLYGCRYPDDIENVAILVDEHSAYSLDIYDIKSMYRVKNGVPAQQAFAEAKTFTRCSFHKVVETRIRRIADDRGGTVGYDVRPIYLPYDVGFSDVMLITYTLKEGKVTAYIRLTPEMKNRFDGSDSSDREGSGGGRD